MHETESRLLAAFEAWNAADEDASLAFKTPQIKEAARQVERTEWRRLVHSLILWRDWMKARKDLLGGRTEQDGSTER